MIGPRGERVGREGGGGGHFKCWRLEAGLSRSAKAYEESIYCGALTKGEESASNKITTRTC